MVVSGSLTLLFYRSGPHDFQSRKSERLEIARPDRDLKGNLRVDQIGNYIKSMS